MVSMFGSNSVSRLAMVGALALGLGGCSFLQHLQEPNRNDLKETVRVLTEDGRLLTVPAARPWEVVGEFKPKGLPTGERMVGIDYRVSKGVLYALGHTGQLYTLDAQAGAWVPLGQGRHQTTLVGSRFDIDFNPTLDRIRVVGDLGLNLRLHPETGLQVDGEPAIPGLQGDPRLAYATGDVGEGQMPAVAATAYTYNTQNEKITTNYVVDLKLGHLAVQGSREGVEPFESPNLGVLHTVGPLGVSGLTAASLDIGDVRNTALLAARTEADPRTRLYQVDLETGKARLLGTLAAGQRIAGLAIEP